HDLAVHGEQLVVSVCQNQVARWGQQLEPDQQGKKASYKKEEGDRNQIQKRNALVVRGKEPRANTIFRVQVILALFGTNCCGSHFYSLRLLRFRFSRGHVRALTDPGGGGFNDFTCATS